MKKIYFESENIMDSLKKEKWEESVNFQLAS